MGKASEYFSLLNRRVVDGSLWYELDHPSRNGTAWIFGEYVDISHLEDVEFTAARHMAEQIFVTFGRNLAKARILFGEPLKIVRKMVYVEGAGEELPDVTFIYSTHTARYVDGNLMAVTVKQGGLPFGSLRVGDLAVKVRDVLGEPDSLEEEKWSYNQGMGPVEEIWFTVRNDRIFAMEYMTWFD